MTSKSQLNTDDVREDTYLHIMLEHASSEFNYVYRLKSKLQALDLNNVQNTQARKATYGNLLLLTNNRLFNFFLFSF